MAGELRKAMRPLSFFWDAERDDDGDPDAPAGFLPRGSVVMFTGEWVKQDHETLPRFEALTSTGIVWTKWGPDELMWAWYEI